MLKWHHLDALRDSLMSKCHATADNTHPILRYIIKTPTYKEKKSSLPNVSNSSKRILSWLVYRSACMEEVMQSST